MGEGRERQKWIQREGWREGKREVEKGIKKKGEGNSKRGEPGRALFFISRKIVWEKEPLELRTE